MTCFEDTTFPEDFYSDIERFGLFSPFAYDNNGNMVEEFIWKTPKGKGKDAPSLDENRAYFYDFDDRLWKVEIARGMSETRTVVEYEYDPLGNRVARKESLLITSQHSIGFITTKGKV